MSNDSVRPGQLAAAHTASAAATAHSALPPASPATPWGAYACLTASMAVVGSYVGLSKLLVAVFPVFLLAWMRFGIAAIAMLPWSRREPGEMPLARRERWLLFAESFFGNFLFSVCMLYGIKLSSALAAGVIMASLPGMVAVLSWWWLGERPGKRVLAGIVLAVAGIAWVSMAKHAEGGAGTLLGNALLVGAVFCEAAYVVIGKRLSAQISAKRISALINLWGLALITPLGLWQALSFEFSGVTPAYWSGLVAYSVAASVITVVLWMTGLKRVPASQAGVFTIWLPISAAAVGIGFLGETFGVAQAGAFVLAMAGLLLATWPERKSVH